LLRLALKAALSAALLAVVFSFVPFGVVLGADRLGDAPAQLQEST
jgi:hypothetical protein